MEITGRLTANAQVRKTKSGKQVTGFSIAINDNYKKEGSTEVTKLVTYINCSYWLSTAIAPYLTKGTIVHVQGRLNEPHIWTGMDGNSRASLSFTVNNIRILGGGNKQQSKQLAAVVSAEIESDLPF